MKILIVKIGAIGDLLMSRAMLDVAPEKSEISWLCGKSVTPLVRQFSSVSEIIDLDDLALLSGGRWERLKVLAGIWTRLAGRRFDLVVTAHSDKRYGLLTKTVWAKKRRSFASDRLVRGRFHGNEYARLVHGVDGPHQANLKYRALRVKKPGLLKGGPWVLLFPGGAKNLLRDNALRRWPLEHYVALSRLLKKRGWKLAFAGAESDAWVRPKLLETGALDFLGRFGLDQTLGLCAEAGLVVTHDSGPMHLAAASGTRVIALFGPTHPAEFAAAYENVEVLWGGEDLSCRPCYDGKDFAPCQDNQCLKSLSPKRVMMAIEGKRAQ
jgi:heptosyltransferase-2